jgi:flagellar L-ring protein precursor FlgH
MQLPINRIAIHPFVLALLLGSSLSACTSTLNKLDEVGAPPKFAQVANPNEKPGYQPMSWPLPEAQPAPKQYANSLWQPGARAFFRDQRAARVGDILRVNIKFEDKAELNNETNSDRTASESIAAPTVFGLETKLFKRIPGKQDPANLADLASKANKAGTGDIKRKEKIETQVAAAITQVLPNGNFAISGSQEIRVNAELRQIAIQGVVRPQDIKSDNTIDLSQIAEARVNYGGRGTLSDVQQPRWGHQVIDALSPF